ncbi:MAG: ferredoxin [Myxococcota bacterium]
MALLLHVEGWEPVAAERGATLLEVCEEHGIPMDSACGGFACCNACRVDVLRGGGLSPLEEEERPFLDVDGQRLGCQARIVGDAAIRLAPGM